MNNQQHIVDYVKPMSVVEDLKFDDCQDEPEGPAGRHSQRQDPSKTGFGREQQFYIGRAGHRHIMCLIAGIELVEAVCVTKFDICRVQLGQCAYYLGHYADIVHIETGDAFQTLVFVTKPVLAKK
ncbi:hypothetical protein BpHYR1_043056 [Brachionus plicatilis]|uniref:Uncharacterized protein n=1 Tax=Brachionus plicatilis TaxID=10195 RepID=A0A3M7RG09_BRAPC|nr:hypothetical protein BpHYR1_043056 [Brachionus plicatilis]